MFPAISNAVHILSFIRLPSSITALKIYQYSNHPGRQSFLRPLVFCRICSQSIRPPRRILTQDINRLPGTSLFYFRTLAAFIAYRVRRVCRVSTGAPWSSLATTAAIGICRRLTFYCRRQLAAGPGVSLRDGTETRRSEAGTLQGQTPHKLTAAAPISALSGLLIFEGTQIATYWHGRPGNC